MRSEVPGGTKVRFKVMRAGSRRTRSRSKRQMTGALHRMRRGVRHKVTDVLWRGYIYDQSSLLKATEVGLRSKVGKAWKITLRRFASFAGIHNV
jgi:hypothetical protein